MATVRVGQVLLTSKVLSNNVEPNIPDGAETTVDTFTASGRDERLTRILMSGDGNGDWTIYIDSVLKWKLRAYDGVSRTRDFEFDTPFLLNDGETIDVKVEHGHTGENLTFESTLEGIT